MLLAALLALPGCATVKNGTSQLIPVSSVPSNARVYVDGKDMGATPLTLKIPREAAGHRIKIEAPGYMPSNIQLNTSTSGIIWCNIIFWPAFIVDLLDDAYYVFTPPRIDEELTRWSSAGLPAAGLPAPAGPARDPAAPRLNIAVSELAADAVSPSDASVIANLLRGELVKTGAFNVVEKKNMDRILAEQAFQQTGCTAQECAVKLGKLLNVQRMIVGSCGKLMDRYFINVRVVNVETGEAVFADEAKGSNVDDIETGIRDMAARMATRQL